MKFFSLITHLVKQKIFSVLENVSAINYLCIIFQNQIQKEINWGFYQVICFIFVNEKGQMRLFNVKY